MAIASCPGCGATYEVSGPGDCKCQLCGTRFTVKAERRGSDNDSAFRDVGLPGLDWLERLLR